MKSKLPFIFVSLVLCLLLGELPVIASKAAGDYPYVHSDLEGFFYARCIPNDSGGGKTEIYQVKKDKDLLVDSYPVYSRNGLKLAWSPIAGKVAMMLIRGKFNSDLNKQEEFAFYLGGKQLAQYSTTDLVKLGAETSAERGGEKRAQFNVIGAQQLPGTNEYDFVVSIGTKKIHFNILTGKQR